MLEVRVFWLASFKNLEWRAKMVRRVLSAVEGIERPVIVDGCVTAPTTATVVMGPNGAARKKLVVDFE